MTDRLTKQNRRADNRTREDCRRRCGDSTRVRLARRLAKRLEATVRRVRAFLSSSRRAGVDRDAARRRDRGDTPRVREHHEARTRTRARADARADVMARGRRRRRRRRRARWTRGGGVDERGSASGAKTGGRARGCRAGGGTTLERTGWAHRNGAAAEIDDEDASEL